MYDQTGEAPITYQETFRLNEDYTVKANVLPGTSTDYSLRVQRDLRKRFEPTALAFGTEVGRNQKADMSVNVRCVPWVDQNYTFTAEYAEDSDPANRQTGAVVDTATGRSIRTLDITAKNDLSARFSLRLPALLQWIGGRGGRGGRGGPAPARPPQPPRRVDLDPGEAPPGGSAPSSPPAPEPAPGAARRPFVLRRLFGAGSDYVEPLSATWRRNMNTNAFDLVRRPSLLYQLGIDDTLRVAKAGQGLTRQDAQSQITSLEGGAGLRLPFGLSLKSDYSAKLSRRSGSTQTRTRVTREERFPRLNLTWSRGDRIPYVRRFLTSAQVNASYASTHTDEGEGSVRRRALLTRGDSREVRASWNGRWKFGPTTTIERVLTDTEEWEYDLADATAGAPDLPPLRGSNEQQRATTSLTVRQNVRPRSLPLFGRLKSDIDLSLKYELESETRATGTGEAARAPIADNDKWKSELTLQYKFSENFRGEGLVRVENNDNRLTDRTRKIREVRLSGTFFLR